MSTFQQRFQQRISVVGSGQSTIPLASTGSTAGQQPNSIARSNSIVSTQSTASNKPSTTSVRTGQNILQSVSAVQSPTSVNSNKSEPMASFSPSSQSHALQSYQSNHSSMASHDQSYSSAVSPQPQHSYMTDYSMQSNATYPPQHQYQQPSQPAPAPSMRSFLQAATGNVSVPSLSKPVVAPSNPKLPASNRQPAANSYTQRHAAANPLPAPSNPTPSPQPQGQYQQPQYAPSHMQQPPQQYPTYQPQQSYYSPEPHTTQPNTDRSSWFNQQQQQQYHMQHQQMLSQHPYQQPQQSYGSTPGDMQQHSNNTYLQQPRPTHHQHHSIGSGSGWDANTQSQPSYATATPVNGYTYPPSQQQTYHQQQPSPQYDENYDDIHHSASTSSYKAPYGLKYSGANRSAAPNYKAYKLSDYQQLPKDVKLGSLGPNLDDAHAEKLAKQQKIKEYERKIREDNTKKMQQAQKSPEPSKDDTKPLSKREIMAQFAAKVPKPKVKRTDAVGSAAAAEQLDAMSNEPQLTELEIMLAQHDADQQRVNEIKRSLKL